RRAGAGPAAGRAGRRVGRPGRVPRRLRRRGRPSRRPARPAVGHRPGSGRCAAVARAGSAEAEAVTGTPVDGAPALQLSDFGLAYRVAGGRLRPVFAGVDLELPAGRFYLVIGPSGSGKSTLLRLLTGLWEAREPAPRMTGTARVLGVPVTHGYPAALRQWVTAVLQDEGLLDELSPRANVRLALRAAGRSTKLDLALLSEAGLPHPPAEVAALSGGMRKRVAVARALAAEPRL